MKCNVISCNKKARYQQNKYTELCFEHFFKCCEGMLVDWRENTYNEKNWKKYQKTVWVFDRNKIIPYDEFDITFAWLHHYNHEFNESPHLQVNRCVKQLQKYSNSYNWK